MNQVAVDLWQIIATAVVTLIITYAGFIHKLRIKVAELDVEVKEMKRRLEGHSKKQDEILGAITDIKDDVGRKLNEISVSIAKIQTVLTIIEPNKD